MTQKEKTELIKAICGYLPYGIVCNRPSGNSVITKIYFDKEYNDWVVYNDEGLGGSIIFEKPYLRPMESMTEEEVKDLLKVHIKTKYGEDSDYYKNLIRIERISRHYDNSWSAWIVFKSSYTYSKSTTCFGVGRVTWETTINEIDWLNAHLFDYRGLIPKGLALPATDGMYSTYKYFPPEFKIYEKYAEYLKSKGLAFDAPDGK